MNGSRLYFGTVMHRRLRPREHSLRYRLFWTLLDLDEIPKLSTKSALFSYNRFNLLSFHDQDHGDGTGTPLRPQIEAILARNHIPFDSGPIRLLCMPRVLGRGFNPISVYFCYRKDQALTAIVYEVHNTFGERHSYVFDTKLVPGRVDHECGKQFYVSPFMDMEMNYEFRTLPPGEHVALAIRGSDAHGILIHAFLTASAAPFLSSHLLRGLLLYPLQPIKVMAAIHWHALWLWLKGIPIREKPAQPEQVTTPINEGSRSRVM